MIIWLLSGVVAAAGVGLLLLQLAVRLKGLNLGLVTLSFR